jgi:hypothetical protein
MVFDLLLLCLDDEQAGAEQASGSDDDDNSGGDDNVSYISTLLHCMSVLLCIELLYSLYLSLSICSVLDGHAFITGRGRYVAIK